MSTVMPKVNFFEPTGQVVNGRAIYVVNDNGKMKKVSVPIEQKDTFEKYNQNLENSMKESISSNISEAKVKKMQRITIASGILGGGIGYFLTRNKKILPKLASTSVGLVAGVLLSAFCFTKNMVKNIKPSINEIKKFDIKNVEES